jgi:pSer/pThr/pTyr-binding forkhead associated (FHA) protein
MPSTARNCEGNCCWADTMYKLVISDDQGHATVVPLARDEITIGRQEGNTIRLTERNVSRSHARILKRNGSYVVEDLGSYNGVTLNGERIDSRAELTAGDALVIGDYDLAFQPDVIATAHTIPSPKPKSQPPPRLVVLSEPALGAEFTLTQPALRIGRDERLDIWINHKSISHEHAEVQVADDKVTVFDLDSANGMRVNGVKASRAILESGDVLELGEVRFRFVPPQGARSLEELPNAEPEKSSSSSARKPLFAIAVIGLLVIAAAGAVLTTMRGTPTTLSGVGSTAEVVVDPGTADLAPIPRAARPSEDASPGERRADEALTEQEDSPPIDAPREWEGQLARAREALANGRLDLAYSIANELPEDSVLRETPEFDEIRYRYTQAHINAGERALEEGDGEVARTEATLVLELTGTTPKQRQDARRLLRSARNPKRAPEGGPNAAP